MTCSARSTGSRRLERYKSYAADLVYSIITCIDISMTFKYLALESPFLATEHDRQSSELDPYIGRLLYRHRDEPLPDRTSLPSHVLEHVSSV